MAALLSPEVIVTAGATLAVTYLFHLLTRTRKRLSATVETVPLLRVDDNIARELKVSYLGQEVQTLALKVIQIRNEGNAEIRTSDYDEAIRIQFPAQTQILKSEIVGPDGRVDESQSTKERELVVPKYLLNVGEAFVVRCLTTGGDKDPRFKHRIAGVKEIEATATRSTTAMKLITAGGVTSLIGLVGSTWPLPQLPIEGAASLAMVSAALLGTGLLILRRSHRLVKVHLPMLRPVASRDAEAEESSPPPIG